MRAAHKSRLKWLLLHVGRQTSCRLVVGLGRVGVVVKHLIQRHSVMRSHPPRKIYAGRLQAAFNTGQIARVNAEKSPGIFERLVSLFSGVAQIHGRNIAYNATSCQALLR